MTNPNTPLCVICGVGYASMRTCLKDTTFAGVTKKTPTYYKVCVGGCGCEYADGEILDRNAMVMRAFKKYVYDLQMSEPIFLME